jgi:hypothetical protein
MRNSHADDHVRFENEADFSGASAACEWMCVAPAAVSVAGFEQRCLVQAASLRSDVHQHADVERTGSAAEEGRSIVENLVAAAVHASSADQSKLGGPDDEAAESKALYLGVALEEQCACEWSGLRIPAVLAGMLSALSTPVDAMLEAWSAGLTFDECNAAAVFGEIESLCVGCPGDADTVCGAIVTKRSAHGAGLDVGLLRLWLRRLPDAVSFSCDVLFLG